MEAAVLIIFCTLTSLTIPIDCRREGRKRGGTGRMSATKLTGIYRKSSNQRVDTNIAELHCDEDFNVPSTSANVVTFEQPVAVVIANFSEESNDYARESYQVDSDINLNLSVMYDHITHDELTVEQNSSKLNDSDAKGCMCNSLFFEHFRIGKLVGKFESVINESFASDNETFLFNNNKLHNERVSYECENSSWKCDCVVFQEVDCACLDGQVKYLANFVWYIIFFPIVALVKLMALVIFDVTKDADYLTESVMFLFFFVLLAIGFGIAFGVATLLLFIDDQIYLSYCGMTRRGC